MVRFEKKTIGVEKEGKVAFIDCMMDKLGETMRFFVAPPNAACFRDIRYVDNKEVSLNGLALRNVADGLYVTADTPKPVDEFYFYEQQQP